MNIIEYLYIYIYIQIVTIIMHTSDWLNQSEPNFTELYPPQDELLKLQAEIEVMKEDRQSGTQPIPRLVR